MMRLLGISLLSRANWTSAKYTHGLVCCFAWCKDNWNDSRRVDHRKLYVFPWCF